MLKDLRTLFDRNGGNLWVCVIYQGDDELHEIGPSMIAGIEGVSVWRKKFVHDVCTIKLKFGDGNAH